MFKLPKLKFDVNKFHGISSKAFKVHHEGHHATYVENLNKLLENSSLKSESLVNVIKKSYEDKENVTSLKIFNNSAQHWNHEFFWESLHHEKQNVETNLINLIEKSFSTLQSFQEEFYKKGAELFGSGWVWLVLNTCSDKLEILQTQNAVNPFVISSNLIPLLVIDVWEHAYYIDYQNKRIDYLKVVIDHLNWEFANNQLKNLR